MAARSHNVAAQVTTLGKRFAVAGEELLVAFDRLEALIERYPLRGIKGPVGTQTDQLDLLGSGQAVDAVEAAVAAHLGFAHTFTNVGQVYPRSLDLEVVGALVQLASGPSSLATTIRLMAGHELATEGFLPGQVGSSAMPHKMNSRSCERVNGLKHVLAGHQAMVTGLAGDQWNEGDVVCSVVRRVALPDAFLAADGLFETFLTVLRGFGAYPAVIEAELDRYLPFLATTKVLMAAVRAGAGREEAHEAIKEHAVAVAPRPCASRARPTTTCSTGWPPTPVCRSTAAPSPRRSPTRWRSPAGPWPRSRRSPPRSRRSPPGTPTPRPTPPATSSDSPGLGCFSGGGGWRCVLPGSDTPPTRCKPPAPMVASIGRRRAPCWST